MLSDGLTQALAERIEQLGGSADVTRWRLSALGGGSINQAYRIHAGDHGGDGNWFIKFNRRDRLWMFEAEAKGLDALAQSGLLAVPKPLLVGVDGDRAFIAMEYLALRSASAESYAALGRGLAQLHRQSQAPGSGFGFDCLNTIGATRQPNDWCDDWVAFWRQRRLGYQLELAGQAGLGAEGLALGQRLSARLDRFFEAYRPQPSLLHGDLWGGNVAALADGRAAIFDPACYYGDREADIAMTELFGGFDAAFYRAYEDVWPLDAGYRRRRDLYNLYHVLNHFVMFGGGYGQQAVAMMRRLV